MATEIQEQGWKNCVWGGDIFKQLKVIAMVEKTVERIGVISVLLNCATENIAVIKLMALVWADFELHLNNLDSWGIQSGSRGCPADGKTKIRQSDPHQFPSS